MNRNQLQAQFSSNKSDWETPQELFDKLDERYHFTLDAASSDANAKCKNHYTIEDNGLHKDWGGQTVWLNPPYGRQIKAWVKKAWEEGQKDKTIVVCLLPARTDTSWFHDYCSKGDVRFIRGRIKFSGHDNAAPFPSMIVVFRK